MSAAFYTKQIASNPLYLMVNCQILRGTESNTGMESPLLGYSQKIYINDY